MLLFASGLSMTRFARTAARWRLRLSGRASVVTTSLVASVVATVAATGFAGCGPDGGIVLEIHRAPGADSEIYRMELRVGVGHDLDGNRALDDTWWLAAPVADGKAAVELPGGLGATTFRFKLDAAAALARDQDLVVAVIGYGANPDSPPILFGHTTDLGVRFVEGEVRVLDLPLENFAAARHGVGKAGCVWWNDDGNRLPTSSSPHQHAIVADADSDCDGYVEGHDEMGSCQLDCNDLDPHISPEGDEICRDLIDQNCCAFDVDGTADPDGDGFNGCSEVADCVDLPRGTVVANDVFGRPVKSEDIHPGAAEICDGLDNDCNDGCDDDPGLDPDSDGWLNCVSPQAVKGVHRKDDGRCVPAALDCADAGLVRGVPAAAINPGADDDQCDQLDNDCSGACDEHQIAAGDGDGDGVPACGTTGGWIGELPVCRIGRVSDCDDSNEFGLPGAFERCDGLDFACDQQLFTAPLPCFRLDGNRCVLGSRACTDGTGAADPIGPCLADANAPTLGLPTSFCSATCAADDITDCLAGATNIGACDVSFPMPQGGPILAQQPCQPADIPLLSDMLAPCRWQLIGGTSQGDWKVTLQRGALSGTSFDTCGLPPVTLRVVGATPDAADRAVLVLTQTRVQVIRLKRHEVNVCAPMAVDCHFSGG